MLVLLQPNIYKTPPIFGAYYAYVFPINALAISGIHYSKSENTRATVALAWILIVIATLAASTVILRTLAQFI